MAVDGVYGIRKDYNSYANLELETYLGADQKPILNDEGYASIQYDYDLSDSNNVEKYFKYYLNTDGKPIAAKSGAWGTRTVYYPCSYRA